MGNSGSGFSSDFADYPEKLKDLLSNYQKRNQVNDDRFDTITVYTSRQNHSEMIAVKENWANSIPDSIRRNKIVDSRPQPQIPSLAK